MGGRSVGMGERRRCPPRPRGRRLARHPVDVNGGAFTAADLLQRAQDLHRAYSGLRHEILDVVTAPGRLVVAFQMLGTHIGPLVTPLGTVPPTGADVAIRTIDALALRTDTPG